MRRIALVIALLLAGPSAARGQGVGEESLREELERVFQALAEGDAAYFQDHYVSDVSRIHLTGGVDPGWHEQKAAGVERFMDRGWRVRTQSYEIADLRIYGNVGITAGVATVLQTMPGQEPQELRLRFSYVWINEDGRWKELHHHVSEQR